MKMIFKIMMLLAFFQIVVIMVNATGVFPYTFYDNSELVNENMDLSDPTNLPSSEEVFINMFAPDLILFENVPVLENRIINMMSIITVFLAIGVVAGVKMQGSFLPVVISLQGYMVFTMLVNSKGFFDKMITNWNTSALTYLALIFGVGIMMLFFITLMETVTQGDA